MYQLLLGILTMSCLVAGLFFLRFWRNTRDPFFLFFAASFWLQAGSRFVQALSAHSPDSLPIHYLVRLIAFGLILFAFVYKNWIAQKSSSH